MPVFGVVELCAGFCVTAPEDVVSGLHTEVLVGMRIIDCFVWMGFGYKFRTAVKRPEFARGIFLTA